MPDLLVPVMHHGLSVQWVVLGMFPLILTVLNRADSTLLTIPMKDCQYKGSIKKPKTLSLFPEPLAREEGGPLNAAHALA